MAIKHTFTSAKADGGDTTLVQPSNWNANHTIDAATITYSLIQDVSATDKLLGRATAGAGVIEEIALTAAGRALIDDIDAAAQRTTLGLGTMATQASTSYLPITGGDITGATTITNSAATGDALRITLSNASATGNALVVEDSTNPDSSPLIIDATGTIVSGNTVPINAANPQSGTQGAVGRIQAHGTTAILGSLFNSTWNTSANAAPALVLGRSKSATVGTHTAVADLDALGYLSWQGSDGTNFLRTADIRALVDGTVSTGIVPGTLSIRTSSAAGTLTERLQINAAGAVIVGPGTPGIAVALGINRSVTGSASGSYAVNITSSVATDVTATAVGFNSALSTDPSVALTGLFHFRASPATFGLGTVVTNQYGFSALAGMTGATNNYGFYSALASATGVWGFYAASTANNAFNGNTRFGSVVAPTATVDITGTLAVSSTASAADPTLSTHLATKNYVDNGNSFVSVAKWGTD